MSTTPICVIDTETTSLHPSREVWEFAGIRRNPDGLELEMEFYLPVDLTHADPFSLNVGGYYDRHPDGIAATGKPYPRCGPNYEGDFPWTKANMRDYGRFKELDEAARAIFRLTFGAVIVGSNAGFDTRGLEPLIRSAGMVPAWHYRPIDVVDRAVGFFAAMGHPLPPTTRTDDVARILGIEVEEKLRHTAMGDVRMTLAIYDAINDPIKGERRRAVHARLGEHARALKETGARA